MAFRGDRCGNKHVALVPSLDAPVPALPYLTRMLKVLESHFTPAIPTGYR